MPAATVAPPHTVDYQFSVDGRPLEPVVKDALIDAVVDSVLHGPDSAMLAFADPESKLADSSRLKPGATLEIKTTVDRTTVILFTGEIVELEAAWDVHGSTFVIRALDKVHRLMSGRTSAVYLKKKASDIVSQVCREAGIEVEVTATTTQHEHVWRVNESSWELINRLALEVGYTVGSKAGKVTFRPTPAVEGEKATLKAGENLVQARAVRSMPGQVKKVTATGWDAGQKRPVTGVASSADQMAENGFAGSPMSASAQVGAGEEFLVGTNFTTQDDATKAARAAARRIVSACNTLTGLALGDPALLGGATVKVEGVGSRFSGKYVVTHARHSISAESYLTEVTAAGSGDASLLSMGAGGGRGAHDRPRIEGVVPAIVTNLSDPENLGRVKVKLPWLDDALESGWLRVAQAWVGATYGAVHLPEVNDEVLVAFDRGDVQQGYVVGSLYNGKDKPAKPTSEMVKGGKVQSRRFVSRTGQGLVLFDEDSKKGMRVRTGDNKFFIDLNQSDTKIDISSDGTVTIKAKDNVVVEGQKDITLDAKQNLTLKAGQNVSVEATQGVKVKANQKVEINGATGVDVKTSAQLALKGSMAELAADGMATVKASGILTVQGSLVKIN